MPVSVSSTPSYGPWEGSWRIVTPESVTSTSRAQLVSTPTGGHSVNGADGIAFANGEAPATDRPAPRLVGAKPALAVVISPGFGFWSEPPSAARAAAGPVGPSDIQTADSRHTVATRSMGLSYLWCRSTWLTRPRAPPQNGTATLVTSVCGNVTKGGTDSYY